MARIKKAMSIFSCPNCGGNIIGDGVISVMRCENVDFSEIWDIEPDADLIYCEVDEDDNLLDEYLLDDE